MVRLWRIVAPLLFLAVVVGVVSVVAASGAFSSLERPPASVPTTAETLVLPLGDARSPGSSGDTGAGGATGGPPSEEDQGSEVPLGGSGG